MEKDVETGSSGGGGGGDPMILDDDEDLLAALDFEDDDEAKIADPVGVTPTESTGGRSDAPLPAVSIEHVLERYDSSVVVTMKQFTAVCDRADECHRILAHEVECLVTLPRTQDALPQVNATRERIILALADLGEANKEERILAKLAHANMEVLVNNEIYNHLARGPQEAPYRVAATIEPVEIGFANDNPALPRRTGAPVDTVRARMF